MKHIALFVIDGIRPDGLQQADTPTMDRLIASGAHTLTAQTVMPSVTLPCHMSLFLGVGPGRHGITTNTWTPQVRPVPGLIEEIHQAGGRVASFYNWEQLRDIARPGALEASFFLRDCYAPEGDHGVAALAASWLRQNETHLAFIYLGYTDTAGHDHGWMSAPYLQAIANADRCIQRVIDALPAGTTILITSDHGGHDQSHGTDSDEDMTIPLLMHGPGIPPGHKIERPVEITDIAPTIAAMMGLDAPREWIGEAIQF
jgi:predicted AlkP superfamily pyrophosphatase or phosphodiesterase